ncbi:MAG TPA: penicillin-binding transpeptidase domain-containing protein, partial [Thermoanaerobaculia bacterium]|nr:penicillin-binding transpeptidase domain-containing protein [Thermoanaerobaculia bacterium]
GKHGPADGDHIHLTIDEVIQHVAEEALGKAMSHWSAKSGSVVVLDPRDGAILALASSPTFDPNAFGDHPPAFWRNRPVQDLYEPGSTFKIVTAAAGLEEGLVTPSQIIDCGSGGIEIAGTRIREHNGQQYGHISFEDVLVHSSNVGTIRVGLSLGAQRFYEYVTRFGFGSRTGVDLPGEGSGILRPTRQWSMLSNAVISIGQEIAATPLQMAQALAVVANGGMLVQPHVLHHIENGSGEGVSAFTPPPPRRVVSDRSAAVLNEMLKAVVVRGTGRNAALTNYAVAGKTGTAQKAERGRYAPNKSVASFGGYVPADRPRLVILVVIDEPRGGQYGGTVAAPVFREIAEQALRYLRVPPSSPARNLPLRRLELATFSQSHAAGGSIVKGIVPDLRGLDERAALAHATRLGIRVAVRGEGLVRTQQPAAGEPYDGSRTVELALSPERQLLQPGDEEVMEKGI